MTIVKAMFQNQLFTLFIATASGLALGKFKIRGISLGTSGTLFVGLLFGTMGFETEKLLFSFCLIIFISAVGLLAAKDIKNATKMYGLKFLAMGISIPFIGALTTYILILLIQNFLVIEINPDILAGSYTGALTSSPGLAAALEATDYNPLITAGHVLTYPFGVIAVILFLHLAPIIFKIDIDKELEKYGDLILYDANTVSTDAKIKFDVMSYVIILALGILLGSIPIKIPF